MSNERPPTRTATPDQTFKRALAFHQNGRLQAADRLYRAVLAADHRHFDALLYLGVLRLQQDDAAEAAALTRRAPAEDPRKETGVGRLPAILPRRESEAGSLGPYARAGGITFLLLF